MKNSNNHPKYQKEKNFNNPSNNMQLFKRKYGSKKNQKSFLFNKE